MGRSTFSGPVRSDTGFIGPALATGAGTGITTGTDTVYSSSVNRSGTIIHTQIYIDIDGLTGSATLADIIGVENAANCHLGQITVAECGVLFAGSITCLETPAGGEIDIDFYSATLATGTEDALVTALDEVVLKISAANWAALGSFAMTPALPRANDYIYMSVGDTDGGEYTAGKFMIELYGYVTPDVLVP